ncbi:unnamed protein product [marine sediment metagenome]|uniref:Uncharacterized protein n=1 Tax=marine sediment metagenome TaxID=412755 RepID=X1PU19_9ZZZZ
MATDTKERERHLSPSPESGEKPKPVTVRCPICEKEIEVSQYDAVTRSDALTKHIEKEHTGWPAKSTGRSSSSEQHPNPGDQQLEIKIYRLRTELQDLRDEAYNGHRGLTISDWVTSQDSPGVVINEERAKATPCKCFTYKGKDYCYSPGIIGMLEAGQVPSYCPTKEYEVRPGIKQRFEEFAAAASAAHKRIEHIPKGERLVPWLTEMGKELSVRGIEV